MVGVWHRNLVLMGCWGLFKKNQKALSSSVMGEAEKIKLAIFKEKNN